MIRRLVFVILALALPVTAVAAADDPVAEVVVVSGSLETRLIDFVIGAIEGSDADVVVLQLDSAATLEGDLDALLDVVAAPPVPVAVYAGPAPATVSGGALRLLEVAQVAGAAPGVVLGPASPTFAGATGDGESITADHPELPASVIDGAVVVDDDLGGFLDLVEPSIGQFVVGLDGLTADVGGEAVVLATAREVTEDGVMSVVPAGAVTFTEPGLIDLTLRLGVGPEVAFFFLAVGLSLLVFEFYAAGPGAAAAVAAICLILGGYGMAVLPVQWWAVSLLPVGVALYTIDFQRNDLGVKSLLGTAALMLSGLAFTDAAPQITQTWWIVLLVVVGVALWFGFALTTVVRSRFSTQTIGRDHLVGRSGVAESSIAPAGTVLVDGARWQALSTRGSGIEPGDEVEVVAVSGIVLEVDPVQ